jgi:hypothetical protein
MHLSVDLLDGRGFNFLTITIAVIALISGTIGVIYARRALFPPKREIAYSLESSAPLINDASNLQNGISVIHNGTTLRNPYVTTLKIRNSGRHAVASEHYDQGRPLTLDLGKPIMDLTSSASGSYGTQGTSITYGPELLPSGHSLKFTALTEGKPTLTIRHYFIDTKVIDEARKRVRPSYVDLTSILAALMGVISALLSIWTS